MKRFLFYIIIVIILSSCSQHQKNGSSITNKNAIEDKTEQRVATQEDNDLNLKTLYHAESTKLDGIDCKSFNQNWIKISAFKDLSIADFQKELMGNKLLLMVNKDFNNDGITEKVLTGVYLDNNNEEGVFITVLSQNNIVFLQSFSINPILIHLRENKSYIYFGTGFGGSYSNGLSFNNGKYSVIEIDN